MATIYMPPETHAGVTFSALEGVKVKKILQSEMPYIETDLGKFAVAIKLNNCDMGYWYFLTPDPSGTIWGHGWDDAKTLSECFTLFDNIDEAMKGLEHLKKLRQNRVSDSAIFTLVQDEPTYIEIKRIQTRI